MSTFKIAFLLIFHRADLSHSSLICFAARSPDIGERIVYWLFDVNEGLRRIANWLELHHRSDAKLLGIKTSWAVGMQSRFPFVSKEIYDVTTATSRVCFFLLELLFRRQNPLKWLTITVNVWLQQAFRRCTAGKLKSSSSRPSIQRRNLFSESLTMRISEWKSAFALTWINPFCSTTLRSVDGCKWPLTMIGISIGPARRLAGIFSASTRDIECTTTSESFLCSTAITTLWPHPSTGLSITSPTTTSSRAKTCWWRTSKGIGRIWNEMEVHWLRRSTTAPFADRSIYIWISSPWLLYCQLVSWVCGALIRHFLGL